MSHRGTHFRGRKGGSIRKREHFIGLWLNNAEYKHLLRQCEKTGLSTSALIRHTVMGIELQPRPPDTYAALLRELSAIGNNVNQLAYWANARHSASEAELQQAAALVREAWRMVKDTL